jgi:hypothetical protein
MLELHQVLTQEGIKIYAYQQNNVLESDLPVQAPAVSLELP